MAKLPDESFEHDFPQRTPEEVDARYSLEYLADRAALAARIELWKGGASKDFPFGKYDPNQPRAPKGDERGGEWVDDPNKPQVLRNPDDRPGSSRRWQRKMREVIDQLPPEHMKLVKGVTVEVVEELAPGKSEGSVTLGQFVSRGWPLGRIEIAKSYAWQATVGGKWFHSRLSYPESTLTHELGHAIDSAAKFREVVGASIYHKDPSMMLISSIRDAYTAMTPREAKNAAYYTNSRSESFAELYALAHTPRYSKAKYFGGMPRDRAEKVFAKPIAEMNDLLSRAKVSYE